MGSAECTGYIDHNSICRGWGPDGTQRSRGDAPVQGIPFYAVCNIIVIPPSLGASLSLTECVGDSTGVTQEGGQHWSLFTGIIYGLISVPPLSSAVVAFFVFAGEVERSSVSFVAVKSSIVHSRNSRSPLLGRV